MSVKSSGAQSGLKLSLTKESSVRLMSIERPLRE